MTDAAATAADGFVFGYPLVLMHHIEARMTAVDEPDPARMRAPVNTFVHARALPEATVGRPAGPHAGTLRSSAWLDLGQGPLVLSVPDTHGRFYALSLVDAWTNIIASVGARATGTDGGSYVIAGAGWSDALFPADALPIRAPTRMARIAGATQVDADGGFAGAHAVQDAYRLTPLVPGRAVGEDRERPPARAAPVDHVAQMDAPTFFSELAALMRDNPPQLEDRALVERMRRLGLLRDDGAEWQLDPVIRGAVADGAAEGLARVVAAAESPPAGAAGGWHIRHRLGRFRTDYLGRAAAACAGLEAGPAADELCALARTDGSGRVLEGRRGYVLTFPPGGVPPVHAFWTLTTFDARQALVDNPVERYSISDWNGLVLEPDGAVQIRIQHADPGADAPNWLPAPPGEFNLLLRLGWPQQEVLDRRWTPPAVRRIDA